jgi:hypothetical protein
MMVPQFPSASVGKIFRNDQLPEHLKRHGCLLAISKRAGTPRLEINQSSHTIIQMLSPELPVGGSSVLSVAAECVELGGDAWLSFNNLHECFVFVRTSGRHTGIKFLNQ